MVTKMEHVTEQEAIEYTLMAIFRKTIADYESALTTIKTSALKLANPKASDKQIATAKYRINHCRMELAKLREYLLSERFEGLFDADGSYIIKMLDDKHKEILAGCLLPWEVTDLGDGIDL